MPTPKTLALRFIAWSVIGSLFAFLVNAYLTFWLGWPGAGSTFGAQGSAAGMIQVLLYAGGIAVPAIFVYRTPSRSLRQDDETMTAIAAYIARAAYWSVLFVGIADTVLSFLRVEGLLELMTGTGFAQDIGRNAFRAPYFHLPLIVLGIVVAARTRTLGFTWLALLVVVAELQIVISRFVFSYEQAFMGDLVRFWYGGLFLFSSAYTLVEEGHVRVDVLYSTFKAHTKGLVNLWGSILLGIPLCWVVLIIGMGQKSSIITSPLLSLEVTQAGFGMYVKYLLAGYLAVFAVTMMIQFSAYMLEGYADYRGDPGKRRIRTDITH